MKKKSDTHEYIYEYVGGLWHCIYLLNGQTKGVGWGITKRIARQAAEQDAGE